MKWIKTINSWTYSNVLAFFNPIFLHLMYNLSITLITMIMLYLSAYTVCPGSSDPFYIASLHYKMDHYFLDILYTIFISRKLKIAQPRVKAWLTL